MWDGGGNVVGEWMSSHKMMIGREKRQGGVGILLEVGDRFSCSREEKWVPLHKLFLER